jgi:hypothetical protein
MNRVAIVPANEFFELDAAAVFRDLTEAILFHARNLNEFRATRNIVFVLTRSGILCPPAPENESRRAELNIDATISQKNFCEKQAKYGRKKSRLVQSGSR